MARLLPDANILINALREESSYYPQCRKWLEATSQAGDTLLVSELVEVALLRFGTHPNMDFAPVPMVVKFWEKFRDYPAAQRVTTGPRHAEIFTQFVNDLNLRGNDMNDAWLAALAIEHRATLVSIDSGFGRFRRLDWLNPLTDL